jgi:hypothetical protein
LSGSLLAIRTVGRLDGTAAAEAVIGAEGHGDDRWRAPCPIGLSDHQVADCERALRQTGADHCYVPLLMAAPGVGWVLGFTIATEIGDLERFPSPTKLAVLHRVVSAGVTRLVWIEQFAELTPTPLDDRLDQPRRHEHRRDQPGGDRSQGELEQIIYDE